MSEAGDKMETRRVVFTLKAEPGSQVYVAGTFNNWDANATPMRKFRGVYRASVPLTPGRHEYKFIVNGVWCADPECSAWTLNAWGSLNSVVTV